MAGFLSRIGTAYTNTIVGDTVEKSDNPVGSEFRDAYHEWGMSESGVPVNTWSAMQHGPVMACVSILAEDVAKIPVSVWNRTADGDKKPAKWQPLYCLLKQPNGWQTRLEFIEMMMAGLVLCGNAYAVVIRDGRGRPLQLVPVHPDRVTLYEAPGGEWFYYVTRQGLHEMAVLKDVPIKVPAEDVFHLRWLSQWHSLMGSRRIWLGRNGIGLGMSLEEHHSRFSGQGARNSGIFTTDAKLTKEGREMLTSESKRVRQGPRNSGAVAVLEQGLHWEQLGLSMVDAQWIESREFQLREAARIFGIPAYKLGVEGKDSGPSMVQQDQEYLNGPISGYCERWKAKLEKFFCIDGDDTFVEWDYEHFLKADITSRYTAKRMSVGGPWMAVNEARFGEGLPPVPDGDKVQKATNMAGLDWTPPDKPAGASGEGSNQSGTPGSGGDGSPERLPGEDSA